MSLSAIPAIFLAVLILLSSADKGSSDQKKSRAASQSTKQVKKETSLSNRVLKTYENAKAVPFQKDESAIYNYITKKFKKISVEDAKKIAKNLVDYGKKYNLDPKFVAALIARESGFKKDAVSVTGAKGLGQIKDFNYKDLRIKDPFKIEENISGTAEYLKQMIKKWNEKPDLKPGGKPSDKTKNSKNEKKRIDDVKLALASYYKGFTAVKTQGVDNKTKQYVDDIIAYYDEILEYEK